MEEECFQLISRVIQLIEYYYTLKSILIGMSEAKWAFHQLSLPVSNVPIWSRITGIYFRIYRIFPNLQEYFMNFWRFFCDFSNIFRIFDDFWNLNKLPCKETWNATYLINQSSASSHKTTYRKPSKSSMFFVLTIYSNTIYSMLIDCKTCY